MVKDNQAFDLTILISTIVVVFLGLKLLNKAYFAEGAEMSWLMVIAIFSWLTSILMFILFSLVAYVSRKELSGIKALIIELHQESRKRKK